MEDSLSHYGIKGMKWGIRRTPAQLGHKTSSKKGSKSKKESSDISEDRKRVSATVKKGSDFIRRNKGKALLGGTVAGLLGGAASRILNSSPNVDGIGSALKDSTIARSDSSVFRKLRRTDSVLDEHFNLVKTPSIDEYNRIMNSPDSTLFDKGAAFLSRLFPDPGAQGVSDMTENSLRNIWKDWSYLTD